MSKQFDQGDWGMHWSDQESDGTPAAAPAPAPQDKKRRGWVFAVLALLVAGGVGGAIVATSGGDEAEPPPALALSDENDPEPDAARPDYLGNGSDPSTTAAPGDTLVPLGDPDAAPAPAPAPVEAPAPAPAPAVATSADSYGIYRGGQIFLEGAVPTQEDSDRIAALAVEVLGPENVINNYTIDPNADDPSQGQIIVEDKVLFASGSTGIQTQFEPLLQQGVLLMAIRPAVTITIVGHTDSEGSDELNDALSQGRADAAIQYMVARGADASRLDSLGRGERDPIATNETPEGRTENRRLEIFIENLLS